MSGISTSTLKPHAQKKGNENRTEVAMSASFLVYNVLVKKYVVTRAEFIKITGIKSLTVWTLNPPEKNKEIKEGINGNLCIKF